MTEQFGNTEWSTKDERIHSLLKENQRLLSELQTLQTERDKLIDGLKYIAENPNGTELYEFAEKCAIEILKELGVTV